MFGAVFGDVIGSYYEIHCTKNYHFLFHPSSTFTDDSVMTTAVCKAILLNGEPITKRQLRQRAREYAVQYQQFYSYFPNAGYGMFFTEWAKHPGHFRRQRSYGNGSAMRAVPIGYAYDCMEQVLLQAKASAVLTHHTREAIQGAQAVASAVFLARQHKSKKEIREFLEKHFRYQLTDSIDAIRPQYAFDSRTDASVPPAILSFLDSHDYESAIRNAVSLGGDADTMACIAGGIAEAYYQEIPDEIRRFCSPKLDSTIRLTCIEFCKKYHIFYYI